MGEEFREYKTRVYEPKVKKEQSGLSKYFVKPITKAMGIHPKDSDSRVSRLTA